VRLEVANDLFEGIDIRININTLKIRPTFLIRQKLLGRLF
jgi:hypothetical protein